MNMPLCSALMRLSNYKTECKIHACWSVSALISFSVLRANKVPAKTGTFLFAFGVWSCRRQRGESPKPDEKVVNKLFFLCIDFFVLSCGCGKFVKLLFCRVAVVQTCQSVTENFSLISALRIFRFCFWIVLRMFCVFKTSANGGRFSDVNKQKL